MNLFWCANIAEGGEGLIRRTGTRSAEEGVVMGGQHVPWSLLWQLPVSPTVVACQVMCNKTRVEKTLGN